MSRGAAPLVGLVGGGDQQRETVEAAVADAGAELTAGSADAVLAEGPRLLVAVGESGLLAVGSALPDVPVLPVEAGRGVRSVPGEAADEALHLALNEDVATESHPVLSVTVDGTERGRAVLDATVVTATAAHISEYVLRADGAALDRVRADGVVVATPAGSPDYARRIGGPILAPGTGVAVVPIAPFRTDPDHWVTDPGTVEIRPLRAEPDVELVIDDEAVGPLASDETVACRIAGRYETVVLETSGSRY